MPLASAKMHHEPDASKVASLRDRWELRLQISEIKALSQLSIGDGAKWLYLHLSSFTNANKKECYPAQKTLVELTGFSLSKLKRCTNELIKAGLIDVKVARKQHRSNTYVVHKPSKPKSRGVKSDPSKKRVPEGSNLNSQRGQICSPRGFKNDPLNNTREINNRNTPPTPRGGNSTLIFEEEKNNFDLWNRLKCNLLDGKIAEPDFNDWFEEASAYLDNRFLVIEVPSNYRRKFIEENYSGILLQSARGIGLDVESVSIELSGPLAQKAEN